MGQPSAKGALLNAAWAPLRVARRVHDRIWDRRLGIDTGFARENSTEAQDRGDGYEAVPTPYAVASRILSRLHLGPSDVVVDVGCGAGRVVCLAARLPIAGAIGIEVLPSEAARARANLERLRRRRATKVEILCVDAGVVDLPRATAYFLFNPFGWETMRNFLNGVERSRRNDGTRVRVVYYNPTLVTEICESFTWIREVEYWEIVRHRIAVLETPSEPDWAMPHG